MSEQSDLIADPQWWRSYMPSTVQDSPVYTQFYTHLPYDRELRTLVSLIGKDQPVPNLFFTAVNFVLQSDSQHPLAEFYPYFHASPKPAQEVYPAFREFCLSHQETLRQILPTIRLQTNEVTRCANLLPAFEMVFQRGGRKPLALVEIGASAGLNLNWDHYGYDYGQAFVGDGRSLVQIRCTMRGEHFPPLPETMPLIASRQGIDLAPLDIYNEDHVRWLRASIWPEEIYRYRLLDAAIAFTRQNPPTLLSGDACTLLPEILARMLSTSPETLLMDEPFGALDAQLRLELQGELLNLWSGSNKSVLFVTHDIEEAIVLGDRIVVLGLGGRIILDKYISLPRPRDAARIRFQPEFVQLHRHLWSALMEARTLQEVRA